MTQKEFLQEYKELLQQNMKAQQKVSQTLDKALRNLDAERRRYEELNHQDWIMRHKNALLVSAPIAIILIFLLGAFLFVSTGHTINFKAGSYQIVAR